MMGLKLYWMPISQPARCVAWALEYAGVEYESVNVMPGAQIGPPHSLYSELLLAAKPENLKG